MPTFKATRIPRKEVREDTLGIFCYYFPQYTYAQAKLLPLVRIRDMLKVARKEQAKYMIDLTRVMSGSHTKKGVNNVLSYFNKILEE